MAKIRGPERVNTGYAGCGLADEQWIHLDRAGGESYMTDIDFRQLRDLFSLYGFRISLMDEVMIYSALELIDQAQAAGATPVRSARQG